MDHGLLVGIVQRVGGVGDPAGDGVEVLARASTGARRYGRTGDASRFARRRRGTQGDCGVGRAGGGRFGLPSPLAEDLIETSPFDSFHRIKAGAVHFALGVDGHDVRVVQLGRRQGFTMEAQHGRRGDSQARRKHFQRDHAFERQLPRLVHHAHPTRPDLPLDHEVAEPTAGPDLRILAVIRTEIGPTSQRR